MSTQALCPLCNHMADLTNMVMYNNQLECIPCIQAVRTAKQTNWPAAYASYKQAILDAFTAMEALDVLDNANISVQSRLILDNQRNIDSYIQN